MFIYDPVIIKGAGDLATAVAHKLFRSGFPVIMTELDKPTCVRRNVSFANCLYVGKWEVEGIKSKKADNFKNIIDILNKGMIPVIADFECNIRNEIKPLVLVDAILAKRNTGISKNHAPIVIGLGPGLKAGVDVDVVIETNRGHNLGRLIFEGYASMDTGIPGEISGHTENRILRATRAGIVTNGKELGSILKKEDTVLLLEGEEIKAKIDGVLRGVIHNGLKVTEGMKIGDIDPRMEVGFTNTISEKARCIAGGVLEAILIKKLEI